MELQKHAKVQRAAQEEKDNEIQSLKHQIKELKKDKYNAQFRCVLRAVNKGRLRVAATVVCIAVGPGAGCLCRLPNVCVSCNRLNGILKTCAEMEGDDSRQYDFAVLPERSAQIGDYALCAMGSDQLGMGLAARNNYWAP